MRKSKTDWQVLLTKFEDNPDKYPSIKIFAESKNLIYNTVVISFKRAKAKRDKLLKSGSWSQTSKKSDKKVTVQSDKVTKSKTVTKSKINHVNQLNSKKSITSQRAATSGSSKVSKGIASHTTREKKELTYKQEQFVNGILEGKTQTQAAIDAGYASANASALASKVRKHKGVSNRIARSREELRQQVGITHRDIVDRLVQIAFSDLDDVVESIDGKLVLKEKANRKSMVGVSKIKIKTTKRTTAETEDESTEIEISGVDNAKALIGLEKMLGYTEGITYNSMRSKDRTVLAIWEKYRKGEITAQDAWIYFDAYGIEAPKAIMEQARAEFKYAIEEAEGAGAVGLDYDTLENLWSEAQAEQKRQKEKFLPQREKELDVMRKDFEEKNKNERKPGKIQSQKTGQEIGKEKPNE